MVADIFMSRTQRGTAYGWYDLFRSSGYVLGPLLGAFALGQFTDPRLVYLCVGFLGALAFLPALVLPKPKRQAAASRTQPRVRWGDTWRLLTRSSSMRYALILEGWIQVATRMTTTFWPLAMINVVSIEWIGFVLSTFFAASLIVKPFSGNLNRWLGAGQTMALGAVLTAGSLLLLFLTEQPWLMVGWAALAGLGEGLIIPTVLQSVSIVSPAVSRGRHLGLSVPLAMRVKPWDQYYAACW